MTHYSNKASLGAISDPATGSTPVYSSGWKNSIRAYGNSQTPAVGLKLENTSPATSGTDSASPSIILSGKGWDSSPAGSVDSSWRLAHVPVQAATVASDFLLQYSQAGSSFGTIFSIRNSTGVAACGVFRASTVLQAQGDGSGVASTTTITDVTAAKDSTGATLGATPTSIAAENAAWLKVYIGTTTAYIPYWTA